MADRQDTWKLPTFASASRTASSAPRSWPPTDGRATPKASAAYGVFLQNAAVPVFQQAAGALKAEGYPFTVNTPAGSVRLVSDHSSHDFIDLRLDTTGARPQVLVRVERLKGRETTSEERPLKPDSTVERPHGAGRARRHCGGD